MPSIFFRPVMRSSFLLQDSICRTPTALPCHKLHSTSFILYLRVDRTVRFFIGWQGNGGMPRRPASDNARPKPIGEIRVNPREHHRDFVSESNQKNQVNPQPGDPCNKSGQFEFSKL